LGVCNDHILPDDLAIAVENESVGCLCITTCWALPDEEDTAWLTVGGLVHLNDWRRQITRV